MRQRVAFTVAFMGSDLKRLNALPKQIQVT